MAIGYLRVSTAEQAAEGHGLDAQRTAIQASHAGKIRWVEDAGRSAKDLDRPGLRYALELLKDGTEAILIVSKLDRLSRSVGDFAQIIKRAENEGWTLRVIDHSFDLATPGGKLMAHMLISFAEFEREMISVRTKDGLAAAKTKGVKLGGKRTNQPPRVPAHVERRIRHARADGRTYRDIAAELNREGVPTVKTGATWHPGTVRYVCQRPNTLELIGESALEHGPAAVAEAIEAA